MKRLAGFYLFAVLVALLPVAFPHNYFVTVVGVTIGINAILAVSLNLFMGYAGQISLGHAAFFGVGAYASGILTTRYGVDPWLAMLAGLAASGLVAALIARPILRLHGHYLAMATLGFGIIVNIVMVEAEGLTGGPDGMTGIPPLPLLGRSIDTDLEWYAVVAVVLLFTVWVSLNIFDSRAGRALRAVHGSEIAARTLGVDTAAAKSNVFVLSALIASFAGSLFAHQQSFISPGSFGFFFSIELVTMVVLGGLGSTFGAVFGAVVLSLLPEVLVVLEDYEVLVFGAVLMLIMIFLPQGLFVGTVRALRGIVARRAEAPVAGEG
ncbi:branched-chain amino acid ABC transporter permease [Inmirania thermothiophila]|uniref:Amino acid/amide ABC transporter membrane protein 2 (HAAT family) n=1 Tax=Inmirania thermothiophila TaxID=1750597 RepID=A0A3N1Y1U7_9GAMM|nr:branched-chain amino acid ABC transporter permease [Inmirania thermothiophila]ROR32491.1 amino acid/amide ABC transporter membrane protein 2 (HAAT family) [Inmirania thermothiophila]